MATLYLDLETRSCADLRRVGTHRYAQDVTTDCLLAAWAIDGAAPAVWYRNTPLPDPLRQALADPAVVLSAHHTAFERLLIRHVLGPVHGWPTPADDRWDCTMARARAAGLPGGLEAALAALHSNARKDSEGQALMLRMCRPRSFDATGRPTWWEDATRMERLGLYCQRDVEGGRWLDRTLQHLSPEERAAWQATEEVNDIGVRFDLGFIAAARLVADDARRALNAELREVTAGAVTAASNVAGLKTWLLGRGVTWGEEPSEDDDEEEDGPPDLRKRDIEMLLLQPLPDDCHDALQIRLEAGKISTRKLDSITWRADQDGRVQGLLSYHGASTGRFAASGGVQIQNFPRNTLPGPQWAVARQAMEQGHASVESTVGRSLDVISRMLRGSIIAAPGHDILAVDYASVEAVGVAWLAGCDHLVQSFRERRPVYEEMGAKVFGLDISEVTKDTLARFCGKTLILGAGYSMGAKKYAATCASQGRFVDLDTAQRAIDTYRDTYPEIRDLWHGLERAALRAVRQPGLVVSAALGRVGFRCDGSRLRMRLPSGRAITYRSPRIVADDRFSTDKLVYLGVDNKTKRWGEQSTYGGRLAENCTQAVCRDLMVGGMLGLRAAGYRVVTTVHDEIVAEVPRGDNSRGVEQAAAIMCSLPTWAAGFPLRAEGTVAVRYSK